MSILFGNHFCPHLHPSFLFIMPTMRSSPPLLNHILGTYSCLRLGLVVFAFALPIVIVVVGFKNGLPLQDSISAYYHAFTADQALAHTVEGKGVSRDWFVGILWAIGSCLIFYHGYDKREDVFLNISGVLLVTVAMVPTGWLCKSECPISLHAVAAILFFVGISYIAIFRSRDTLCLVRSERTRALYSKTYGTLGALMLILPFSAVLAHQFNMSIFGTSLVFWIEALGIYVFSIYWLVKSFELRMTNADQAVASGYMVGTTSSLRGMAKLFDMAPSNCYPQDGNGA